MEFLAALYKTWHVEKNETPLIIGVSSAGQPPRVYQPLRIQVEQLRELRENRLA